AVRVAEGQDVIGLQGLVDGDEAHLWVVVEVRRIQFAGIDDLEVLYLGESQRVELVGRRRRATAGWIVDDAAVFRVVIVGLIGLVGEHADLAIVWVGFPEVHETYDLTGTRVYSVAVGHPDLDAEDLHLGGDDG